MRLNQTQEVELELRMQKIAELKASLDASPDQFEQKIAALKEAHEVKMNELDQKHRDEVSLTLIHPID